MLPISVVTIAHHREAALINLIKGLMKCHIAPTELVIIYMNDQPYQLPITGFPVREVELHTSEKLPLASARNLARQHAQSEHIVFLDADCVPHIDLIGAYQYAFSQADLLWLGPVRYLCKGATDEPEWLTSLDQLSSPDAIRQLEQTVTYENFWSLNFGCSKSIFDQVGGFDESYKGYGAEDTDFAFSARKQGVKIDSLPALAYHQHHPSYSPPLNHLQDIVLNASRFKSKWNQWPMEGWLQKFNTIGLVKWNEHSLQIIKQPTPEDLAATLKP